MPDDKENIKKGNEGLKQQKDTIYSLNAEYEQVGNTIETKILNTLEKVNETLKTQNDFLGKIRESTLNTSTIQNKVESSLKNMKKDFEAQLKLRQDINKGADISKQLEEEMIDLNTRRTATQKLILQDEKLSKEQKEKLIKDLNKQHGKEVEILNTLKKQNKEKGNEKKDEEEIFSIKEEIANKMDKTGKLAKLMNEDTEEGVKKTMMMKMAFAMVVDALLEGSDKIANVAKQTGLSANESRKLAGEFAMLAVHSDKLFVTSKDIGEAFGQLTNQFGINADLGGDILQTQVTLTKQLGMSSEKAGKLSAISRLQSKDTEQVLTDTVDTVNAMTKQSGVAVNVKGIMNEIASASDAITVSLQMSPVALAEAATQALLFGANLAQVDAIAGNLLDFEQSINNELEFELLTGSQINLEKARLLALNNDLAGLGEELANQAEITEAFATGNRIEQEAAAKAIGMSREELAGVVMQQEMNALAADEFKEKYGEATYQQLQSQSASEKFAATMDKVKGIFGDIGIIFAPILDGFAKFVGYIAKSKVGLVAIVGVLAVLATLSVISAIANIFASLGQLPFGIGIPIAIAAVAGLSAMIVTGIALATSKKNMRTGGMVSPSPGGTDVTVAEAGEPEIITPVSTAAETLATLTGADKIAETTPTPPPSDEPLQVNVVHDSFQANSFMAEEGRHMMLGKHATGKMR